MLTIDVSKNKSSKKLKLIEELAPEDGCTYDVCMQNTNGILIVFTKKT